MFLLSPGFTNSGGIESRFYKLESSPVQSSPVQLLQYACADARLAGN